MRIGCASRSVFGAMFCVMMLCLQGKIENGAGSGLGFQPDRAAVALDDLLDEGQADPGALFGLRIVLKPFEYAEDFVVEFGRNASPFILDVEHVAAKAAVGC